MLSLAEKGIGSKWMTGALGAAPEDVMAAVGAPAGEEAHGRDLVRLPGEGFGRGREGAAARGAAGLRKVLIRTSGLATSAASRRWRAGFCVRGM